MTKKILQNNSNSFNIITNSDQEERPKPVYTDDEPEDIIVGNKSSANTVQEDDAYMRSKIGYGCSTVQKPQYGISSKVAKFYSQGGVTIDHEDGEEHVLGKTLSTSTTKPVADDEPQKKYSKFY
mmetsp:Transcript_12121/g.18049  ORF Transcript_12121/g.18049 Transcript_12121/m.18049 type:complete len:124 (-) Transcript_12121:132-503(-)